MKKIILEKSIVGEILRLYNDEMLGSPSISEKLNMTNDNINKIHKNCLVKIREKIDDKSVF